MENESGSDVTDKPGGESPGSESAAPGPTVGVLLPAGGSGLRLGGQRKQFRLLGDAPVLVQTARAFAGHPDVAAVVVVAPAPDVADVGRMLAEFGVVAAVVAGGASRAASVACGLAALEAHVEIVLVHDAVRPFVSADLVERVVAAVRAHGAAAAAVRVSDTLRRGAGLVYAETVERDGMWAMQTPQGARRDLLEAAYAWPPARRVPMRQPPSQPMRPGCSPAQARPSPSSRATRATSR